MNDPDLYSNAVAFYDGGWRSGDLRDLMMVYRMTHEEAEEICKMLKKMEEKMEIERLLALAYDGALHNWANAKENYSQYPTNLNRKAREKRWNELQEITQLQREYEEEIKGEYNPIAKAIGHIESRYKEQMSRIMNTRAKPNDKHYIVRLVPLDDSVTPTTEAYSTLAKATDAFLNFSFKIQMHVLKANVFLYKERNGYWYQLKVTMSDDTPEQPKAPQQPQEYAVDAIHLNNEIQRLRFENRKAADAMYEMLRYELKAGRIQRAVLLEKTAEGYKVIKDIERDDV